MTDYEKPSEMTYRHYTQHVETAAEVAIEAMEEYPEDYDNVHESVEYAVGGSQLIHNYGYMLMTVLLSDQDPDNPDYCSPWTVYAGCHTDRDGELDISWSGAVTEMAYVCYYSDVMEKVKRMLEEDDE